MYYKTKQETIVQWQLSFKQCIFGNIIGTTMKNGMGKQLFLKVCITIIDFAFNLGEAIPNGNKFALTI